MLATDKNILPLVGKFIPSSSKLNHKNLMGMHAIGTKNKKQKHKRPEFSHQKQTFLHLNLKRVTRNPPNAYDHCQTVYKSSYKILSYMPCQ